MNRHCLGALLACCLGVSAHAGTEVISAETVEYLDCLVRIKVVGDNLGIRPVYIVDTDLLTIARFPTNDGSGESILVTCSQPDRKMIINRSWGD